ncbi:hypothetical protein [Mycobacterium sp. 23]|uniref:hypothetical protein n=1 Tax=Mycobacterium sp. 23 TaxID=3400424 RepID=UPI003AAAAC98
MANSELFTLTFWQATIARMAHYAATFALAGWGLGAVGSTDTPAHLSVPSAGVAIAAGLGALYALLISVAGAKLTPGATPLGLLFPTPSQVLEVRQRPRTEHRGHVHTAVDPPVGSAPATTYELPPWAKDDATYLDVKASGGGAGGRADTQDSIDPAA